MDDEPVADAPETDVVGEVPADPDPVAEAPVEEAASTDEPSADEPSTDEPAPADEAATEAPAAPAARRVSEFHEIRDGGYGMGSAAALEDGAQPLDHPVQAYRDTMTYRLPEDDGYADAVADVWFYDAGAAERSGFHRSEG